MTKESQEHLQMTEFTTLIQNPEVLENLTKDMGFKEATPIQAAAIPAILSGKHVYAGAKTGSGKTVAFLAPMAQLFYEGKIRKALVLSPVRELALQIDEEAMKVFGEDQSQFVSVPLYGGVPIEQQIRGMKSHNPCLYIATPGRMIDFISEGAISLSDVDVCVLDEADRMCDMGFSDQVTEILSTLPNCKQFLMFSATLPKDANEIMNRFLKDPIKIQIDRPQESSSTIRHEAFFCRRHEKTAKLESLLSDLQQSCIIFCRTRKSVDRVYDQLKSKFNDVGILHAGFSMGEREKTIRRFKEGRCKYLVATDVAARGLDVEEIELVVHYELPESTDDYIHRSGRAGRAGRSGVSIALVEKDNFAQRRFLEELQKNIKIEVLTKGSANRQADARPPREQQARDQRSNHDSERNRPDRSQSRRVPMSPTRNPRPTEISSEKAAPSILGKAKAIIFKVLGKKESPEKEAPTFAQEENQEKQPRYRSRSRGEHRGPSRNSNNRNSSNRGPRHRNRGPRPPRSDTPRSED